MAKIAGPIKSWRLRRRTAKKQRQLEQWKKYRKQVGGRYVMPLARWVQEGKPTGKATYYTGAKRGRKTADELLREIKAGKR